MSRLLYVFVLFRVWVPAIQESPKLVEMVSNKPYNYFWCSKVIKNAGVDGFISDVRAVNNTPTLSVCSSSSKEAKTKVDATL